MSKRNSREEVDITKNARTVDWLKCELLDGVGRTHRAFLDGTEEDVRRALANVTILAYLLGRRLGIEYEELEAQVQRMVATNIREEHQIEEWYGDLSALRKFLRGRDGPSQF